MATDDPFSIVLDRLWEIVEDHDDLPGLVSTGNRIKRAGASRAGRHPTQDADLPRLDIRPSGGAVNLHATSSAVSVEQTYTVLVQTGTDDETDELLPIQWHLLRLFHQADAMFHEQDYVKRLTIELLEAGMADEALATGAPARRGWQAVMDIVVLFTFDKVQHMQAEDPHI